MIPFTLTQVRNNKTESKINLEVMSASACKEQFLQIDQLSSSVEIILTEVMFGNICSLAYSCHFQRD